MYAEHQQTNWLNRAVIIFLVVIGIFFIWRIAFSKKLNSTVPLSNSNSAHSASSSKTALVNNKEKERVNLDVPFIPEVDDGRWVPPWNNACEEASIIMVEQFYLGTRAKNRAEEKALMQPLFTWEVSKFGSHADTNAARTARIINEYSSFTAQVVRSPSLEQIKDELREGRPVISFHYGYGLNNPLLRFRRGGSSYHVSVLVGFDEEKKEFIMNDTGHIKGLDWRYTYDTIFNTLHDFDHETHLANGAPTVIFTSLKQIVKANGKGALYLIENDTKRYITHPRVFKNHRWSWGLIKTINAEELAAYATEQPIRE